MITLHRLVSGTLPAGFQQVSMDAQWMPNGCRMDAPFDI